MAPPAQPPSLPAARRAHPAHAAAPTPTAPSERPPSAIEGDLDWLQPALAMWLMDEPAPGVRMRGVRPLKAP